MHTYHTQTRIHAYIYHTHRHAHPYIGTLKLTFAELNERANKLAAYLRSLDLNNPNNTNNDNTNTHHNDNKNNRSPGREGKDSPTKKKRMRRERQTMVPMGCHENDRSPNSEYSLDRDRHTERCNEDTASEDMGRRTAASGNTCELHFCFCFCFCVCPGHWREQRQCGGAFV